MKEEYETKLADQKTKAREAIARQKEESVAKLNERTRQVDELKARLEKIEEQQRNAKQAQDRGIESSLVDVRKSVNLLRITLTAIFIIILVAISVNQLTGWYTSSTLLGKIAVVGGLFLSIYGTLQQFAHWPAWGLGTLLNSYGKHKLRRGLEKRGLISLFNEEDFVWDFGLPKARLSANGVVDTNTPD